MDEEIYKMVAKDVKPPEIVIQGKGKEGKNPETLFVGIFNQFFDGGKGKGSNLDTRILTNVRLIVELKGNMKGVGVGYEGYHDHQSNRQKVLDGDGLVLC